MASKDEKKEPNPPKSNAKPYGRVLLTLKNQLLPEDKLTITPSQNDGLSLDAETDLRIYGCELIQTAGILLKLPQVAMATGQVLLQRFYYTKSLVRHPVEHTAMACVCLASKIEEAPRRARDIINVFTHIRQVNSGDPIHPVVLDQNYIHLKNLVIKAERRVLKELGFCVHIKHPHKIIVMYLQVLNFQNNQKLMQYSWNYMNDSLRTDVFVRYQPETVACACIYLTARKLKLPLPKNPHWFTFFGATEKEIRDICIRILKLYSRPKPNIDDLEKQVEDLCEKYKNQRAKAKGISGNNSPNNNSQDPQKTSAHNAWGGFISRSGSHMPPPVNDKRSRSRSQTRSPDRRHASKKAKKYRADRSRTRSPKNHKKNHKRKSYSRSRSDSPRKSRKTRDRKRSRSYSNDRDSKNDRYIDRYDDRNDKDKKYSTKDKYKEDRDRDGRHEDRRDSKKYEREREEKNKEDKYAREDKYSSKDDSKEKYASKEEKHKKSKHRERSKSRSKDKRRRS
ncbi:cyclin-L2 [Anthonomus grandis grandis]|uniref:cyclin-L2 n=1 Tax=Anthonomus grandis grandis TaxID=2921223 RepID=UPI002165D7E4|nr:cyclin-L2 [Anthonomus grandis grandis]